MGHGQGRGAAAPGRDAPEPAARKAIRIGFGVLWLFDGILQAQPAMAAHFPAGILRPAAASSPPWVQTLVNFAGTNWSHYPVQTAAAAVWVEVGIGTWLLASPRTARLAGLMSAAWGIVVWIFGEALGGLLAPGQTWLFGAPGAVAGYVAAGLLLALPGWTSRRRGQAMAAGTGLFLLGMAVLQAWPGRGFWQGRAGRGPGPLAALTSSMTQMSQPAWLSAPARAFIAFDQAHGFAVNLAAVTVLAVIGALFLSGGLMRSPGAARAGLIAFTAACLADWMLIQDFGFLGGLGTDPGSMPPMIVLATASYLALTRQPAAEPAAQPDSPLATLRERVAGLSFRSLVAACAIATIILGVVPLAGAQIFTQPG